MAVSIFKILVVIFTTYLIVSPYFKKSIIPDRDGKSYFFQSGSMLNKTIEDLYRMLAEIEFDYHMKKLSKYDYETLKSRYKKLAAHMLKNEQKTENRTTLQIKKIEEEIEKEVAEILNHMS